MLQITVPATEFWNEETEEFIVKKAQTIQLEHSLVSLSKWESKWCKPFLTKKDKTNEELMDYIKFMTITQNVSPDTYDRLTDENYEDIKKYISAPMTATTFSGENSPKNSHEIVTSELIYYWMIALNIPSEYQKWHLNRLLTLIRVCNVKNAPRKKKKTSGAASNHAAINAARRKKLNTKG